VPVNGGAGAGQFSGKTLWIERGALDPCRSPASALVAAAADLPAGTYAIVNHNNTQVLASGGGVFTIEKISGAVDTRDAGAVSSAGIAGDFALRLKHLSTIDNLAWNAGMNSDPLTDDDYASIDFSWFYTPSSTLWTVGESGAFPTGNFADATYAWIWRSGTTLGYGRGADLATAQASPDRTVTSSATLYFDSSIPSIGGQFEALLTDYPFTAVTGSATLTLAPSATISGKGDLTASASVVLAPSGTLAGKGAITGSGAVTLAPTGTLLGKGAVSGSSALVLSPSGTVAGKGAVSGASSLTFAPSGTLGGAGALSGASTLALNPVGTLFGKGELTGSSALSLAAAATLAGAGSVSGTSALALSGTGSVEGRGVLTGSAALAFFTTGALDPAPSVTSISGAALFALVLAGSLSEGPAWFVRASRPPSEPITDIADPSDALLALTATPAAAAIIRAVSPPLVDLEGG
jgi:hypothetical protein